MSDTDFNMTKMLRNIIQFSLVAIFAIGCDTNDDGFYNETYIEAENNLVEIEQQTNNYSVNDVLLYNAVIPELLKEKSFSNLLDIRQTTGNATRFNFTVIVEKSNADGTWNYVNLSNQLVVLDGLGETGNFIKSTLVYSPQSQEYRFRGGITLVETGNYRMSFGISTASNSKIELRSESPGQNLQMNIRTSSDELDANGKYIFTVN